MNAALHALLMRVRRRAMLAALLPIVPWLLAALFALTEPLNVVFWLGLVAAFCLSAWVLSRSLRAHNKRWLWQRLDSERVDLEDSAGLLERPDASLSPLQQVQRDRVLGRLTTRPLPELRRPLPWKASALSCLLAVIAVSWPMWLPRSSSSSTDPVTVAPTSAVLPQTMTAQVEISPPPYTGLAATQSEQLNLKVAQDSELKWTLQFSHPPAAVILRFINGETLPLRLEDGRFVGLRSVSEPTLYRIEVESAAEGKSELPDAELHRIDVVTDRPPQISVRKPERTLTVVDTALRQWSMEFDVEDDYGLAGAELVLSLAQGSGEQVTVSERRLRLSGEGDQKKQRFSRVLDLNALGFARGDDLIARLEVRDNRRPIAQTSRSPALILRWPNQPAADGSGVEGLVQRTLPAYFRSQRQIIIDTEALIAERPALDADTVMSRSDALGVDQRILRMRYGQFLGEESEAGDLPGSGSADTHDEEHADSGAVENDGHGHDEPSAPTAAGFGEAGSLMAEVGHLHDIAEAATLLDPRTKKLLRAALAEMWQAEGELRTGKPESALPFEYRALELIKQVQQANRIYLARVGLELPPVDFSRRLSGEGRPNALSADTLVRERAASAPVADWWQALNRDASPPLQAIGDWVAASPPELGDPLGALTELDALRRTPSCQPCRKRLQNYLWPAMKAPAATPRLRADGGASGQHYLEQIGAAQ